MSPAPRTTLRRLGVLASAAAVALASTASLAHAATTPGEAWTSPEPIATSPASPGGTDLTPGTYIVQLTDFPAATYDGGVAGLAATRPDLGERLISTDANVVAYTDHLRGLQDELAREVGIATRGHMTTTWNGFTADLTQQQIEDLLSSGKVASLTPDEPLELATVQTPEFLELTSGKGAWRAYGTPRRAGEGVVVGVIDSGVDPSNPSFAGRPLARRASTRVNQPSIDADGNTHMRKSDGNTFTGSCKAAERWAMSDCNSKIISARYFAEGYLKEFEPDERAPEVVLSPLDTDGHGSHTAGTAVGNFHVPMTLGEEFMGRGSGMAPAAKLAVYKSCFSTIKKKGLCWRSDTLQAVNQAVADGVDVINYSIGGTRNNPVDPTEVAFLNAAAAGVFVAAAAGNDGPAESTVVHPSPWITTVGASNHRNLVGTIVLGNGASYLGESASTKGVPEQTALVAARAIPAEGSSADDAALCKPGSLDPAKASGKIVLCDRGAIARTAKSTGVNQAGGVGMILRNMTPMAVFADVHQVPSVHVDDVAGAAIGTYADGDAAPTAAILPGNPQGLPSRAIPAASEFSSRGPSLTAGGALLKPDISAPGAQIVSAGARTESGHSFEMMSGTSMSSPHIAGLAALIYGKHPNMDPMSMKSAMMTTAKRMVEPDGTPSSDAFKNGAGLVDPTRFYNPGFVYPSGALDWLKYLRGLGANLSVDPIRAIDLNVPSFAVPELYGKETVHRRVTSTEAGTFKASATIPGFTATFSPAQLTFTGPGETKEFSVTFTRTDAPLDTYAQGSLTWQSAGNTVTSPVVLRPRAFLAPPQVNAATAAGEATFSLRGGINGSTEIAVDGFAESFVHEGTVEQGSLSLFRESPSMKWVKFTVPENAKTTIVEVIPGKGAKNLNLFVRDDERWVFYPSLVAGFTSKAGEKLTIRDMPAGDYWAMVHGGATDGAAEFTLKATTLPGKDLGNVTVTPNPAPLRIGESTPVTLKFPSLDASKSYLGRLTYPGSEQETWVTLNPAG